MKVSVESKIQPESNKRCLFIDVADTGAGIRTDDMTKLFKPYQVLDQPSTMHSQGNIETTAQLISFLGTGLGLVIAKNFCKILGGNMTAKSEFGKGSTFSFYVPYGDSECPIKPTNDDCLKRKHPTDSRLSLSSSSEACPRIPPEAATLEGRKVLVVDDNGPLRKILSRALTRAGCQCVEAENGQLAVQALRSDPCGFDIVILDLIMPVMDGYESFTLCPSPFILCPSPPVNDLF